MERRGNDHQELRILSIDGGGIRGIIPAKVLTHIEEVTGSRIADLFDVIAGTSTGGILALGLTCPGDGGGPRNKAQDLVDLYVGRGADIFTKAPFANEEKYLWPLYRPTHLEKALADYLGDARLKDAVTRVTVTAYETERRAPFFFRSVKAAQNPAEYDYFMRDVGRATSAAPTYFPAHRIDSTAPDYYSLVDGGVFANNPGMCAYVDALSEARPTKNVIMVSLGTGSLTRPLKYDEIKNWGELPWVQPVISVMMDGVSNATDYQLAQILGADNYYRLQTTLDIAKDEMDDASPDNIRDLQLQADRLIESSSRTLETICDRLKVPPAMQPGGAALI
jgi:patatin-like phospholipase/acyl hydrolase